ncbi:succinate dehydrogenase assembly factor 2 [Ramlibacter tataouinensis]|uniref:FAD assembly factor SdhE n=1 Tax=Ramlibacter tataouinensis (strain ATCC BAA-407 / DSM 14655 / LMG 21543 / TTB310) TaxID=365046 RepID=F5Y575_RAMTT|nr:succinate dehydrogenase assembly factor 2 [Ramlibacter tataouinensis]AEG93915.1 Conserved hypothetical protein [Ramlibacter tataouinensis TTB310]
MTPDILDEHEIGKLRWRCRRGLLENDLILERFFQRHAANLTARQAQALEHLMQLPDNDLLDLLLRRKEPEGEWAYPELRDLLDLLRS